jgi:mxaD protein
MRTVTETARLAVDAQTLWHDAGGFDAVGKWHPMLAGVETNGDGVGAARTARVKDGTEQVERLESLDPERHKYRYKVEHTSMPVRDFTAEFSIDDSGDDASRLIWWAEFDLAEGGNEKTVESVRQFMHAGIENLKAWYGEAR